MTLASVGTPAPDPPGPARVCVARADHILIPAGILSPKALFPKGRVDMRVVEKLVDSAVQCLTGEENSAGWLKLFSPAERIGIMVDVGATSVQVATVEVIINRLVSAGVPPRSICVFGGDEHDLFTAGFSVSHDASGVRAYGTESEGYRGGISRVVTDYCDTIINVATLRADGELGMAGCVANALVAVPVVERHRLRARPDLVPSVASHPALRLKQKLSFLEAYVPLLDAADPNQPTNQYRGLIVSQDPVAADAVGQLILQRSRDAVKGAAWPLDPPVTYLQSAGNNYRLGQASMDQITVDLVGATEGALLP